jgi:hypothetical protein
MGMYIQPPGNQCLEYKDWEIIGKCNILVATTSALNANVGCACSVVTALPTDKAVATIKTLKAK